MNWNKDNSIALSRFFLMVFAFALAFVDIFAYRILLWLDRFSHLPDNLEQTWLVLLTLYASSAFAWLLLIVLWQLLKNLKAGNVFVVSNIRYLRIASWSCAAISIIYLLSSCYYFPMIIIAIAAGFLALIIRIIKNVFEQASAMKHELDLTV